MIIFTSNITNRIKYVFDFILEQQLGITFSFVTNKEEFVKAIGAKINYSEIQINDAINIVPHYLLQEEFVQPLNIETILYKEINCPFVVQNGDLSFDIFSAIFYLITRYEEYLPHQQNQYGQFKAEDSFAFKNGFLHLPIVDIWIEELKNLLLNKFSELIFKQKIFTPQFTYDIDTAYAFKGKPFLKNIALIGKDIFTLNFTNFKNRINSITNSNKDIYDTYNEIITANKNLPKPIFFFLVGDAHTYNKNLPWNSKTIQKLINFLIEKVIIGLHPSYETPRNKKLIAEEKNRLEHLTGTEITFSRQHYLRYYMPTTFNCLLENGITNDYTIGYTEKPGFRASTCNNFYFFDLVQNKTTTLLLYPVTFMEGTFAEDLNLKPNEALPKILHLINEVKKVNGNFICIWHNHTLSDYGFWKGWKDLHNAIINEISC